MAYPVIKSSRFFAVAGQEVRMQSISIQGSNTSPTSGYVTIATTPASGITSGWNTVSLSSNVTAFRYLRYFKTLGGGDYQGDCAEVEFRDAAGIAAAKTGAAFGQNNYPGYDASFAFDGSTTGNYFAGGGTGDIAYGIEVADVPETTVLKFKTSNVPNHVPTLADLADGEGCNNTADKIIYQRVGGAIVTVANYNTPESYATLKTKLGFTTRHLSEFANFADAMSQIADNLTELIVDQIQTFSSNPTTNANTFVNFQGAGGFYVNSGYTPKINNMVDPGNRQVFFGPGKVLLGRGAVKEINVVWYSGNADYANITAAMSAIQATCLNNSGANVVMPAGRYDLDASILPQLGMQIRGAGGGGFGALQTVIRMTTDNPAILLSGLRSDVVIEGVKIDLTNRPGAGGILATGADNTEVKYFTRFSDVYVEGGLYGYKVFSNGVGFENILTHLEHCKFVSNKVGFSCDTVNSGFSFNNCYFSIPTSSGTFGQPGYVPAGIAHEILSVGTCAFIDCLVVGNQTHAPNTPPTDGSTMLYTGGSFNKIVYERLSQENFQFMHRSSTNYNPIHPITFRDSVIQSDISPSAVFEYTFDNCKFFRYADPRIFDNGNAVTINIIGRVAAIQKVLSNGSYIDTADDFYNFIAQPKAHLTRVFNKDGTFNKFKRTPAGTTDIQTFDSQEGTLRAPSGVNSVGFYNYFVGAGSVVIAQVVTRGTDTSNAEVKGTVCTDQTVNVNLTGTLTGEVEIYFKVISTVFSNTGLAPDVLGEGG